MNIQRTAEAYYIVSGKKRVIHPCTIVARGWRSMLAFLSFFFTLLFLLVLLTENVFVLCFVLFVQAETLGMTYSINAMYKYSEARTQQIQGIPVTLESALKGTISAPRHWLTQRREKFAKGTTSSSTLMGRQSGKMPQSPLRLGNVSNLCNPAEYGCSRTEPRASRLRQKNEKIMRRSNAQTG